MDTAAMVTPTTTPHSNLLLTLPLEIRNDIYRLLYHSTAYSARRLKRSAQLLRTCKQICAESLPILYGEKTFEVVIENTDGPHYTTCSFDSSLGCFFAYEPHRNPHRQQHRESILPHLRRFRIRIKYTYEHSLQLIRTEVREFVERVRDVGTAVTFLKLDCKLDCDNENTQINWRDECWDGYDNDGSEKECVAMLRTWFGRLCDVKEVVIEGLPARDAEILRERMQTSSTQDTEGSASTSQTMALADMYTALEKHANGIPFCEQDLKAALLAAEGDDVEEFRARKDAIHEGLKRHWEAIKNDEKLWQF